MSSIRTKQKAETITRTPKPPITLLLARLSSALTLRRRSLDRDFVLIVKSCNNLVKLFVFSLCKQSHLQTDSERFLVGVLCMFGECIGIVVASSDDDPVSEVVVIDLSSL